MKKIFINTFVLMLLVMLNVSCLEGNLDDLDTYKGNDIKGVAGVFSPLLWSEYYSWQWRTGGFAN